ncbi:unnamed protein product [Ixodes hexagonus]
MSTSLKSSVPAGTDGKISAMAMISVNVSRCSNAGLLQTRLQRFLWCIALCLPVPSMMFRLASLLLCWGKETDQIVMLGSIMTVVREVVALVSGAIYCFGRSSDVEAPMKDSFSRSLRVSSRLEMFTYSVLYLPHLFKTFLLNNSEALMTMLFFCVDVNHLDYDTMSKSIFIGDYIGFMTANALISWLALRYALGMAALRAELLSQPRCSLWSILRRRRRLARGFAVPLFLWGFNTAVSVTIALRQSIHSSSVRRMLWALLISSLVQVAHSAWTLVLVAWAVGALKRSLTDALRARLPKDRTQLMASLMCDNPDALGFFSPDGRCLVRLMAASLGYGVVLYQLTVPYSASTRTAMTPTALAPYGPRYC